ncbi:MAG: hypothetical protein M1832_002763 [Thelocarpon impressellum]|nr:MAG: hypothetical protein M1832_002763 [Thelocarpon impressellum]
MTPAIDKKRKISMTSILSASTRSLSSSSSSSSEEKYSSQLAAIRAKKPETLIEVPDVLDSKETLIFIGLTDAAAEARWQAYLKAFNSPDDEEGYRRLFGEPRVITFACTAIEDSGPDGYHDDEDWDGKMRAWGINRRLRTAIMDPEYMDVRLTQTLKFWVLQALETEYDALARLRDDFHQEMMWEQRQMSRASSRKPGYSFSGDSARPPGELSVASSTGTAGSSLGLAGSSTAATGSSAGPATTNHPSAEEHAASHVEAVGVRPRQLPGHTMIYRGTSISRCKEAYDAETGRLDLEPLRSRPPGDFSGSKLTLYFTTQEETARRYVRFSENCQHLNLTYAIFQLAVPDALLDGPLKPYNLWFSQSDSCDWKRAVWVSRSSKDFHELTGPYNDLPHLAKKNVLQGHIATGVDSKFTKIASHTKIKESHILTVKIGDDPKAKSIQWAIQTRVAREALEEACQRKCWITPVVSGNQV